MLIVAKVGTGEILFRVDAWDSDCMTKAARFIKDNNLMVEEQKVTMNGDMIVWVQ